MHLVFFDQMLPDSGAGGFPFDTQIVAL